MNINWRGQSCFQITSSQNKNNQVSIVIDPYDDSIGLKAPKLQADVLLISHDHRDHNNTKAVSGNPLIINGPGEYDVKETIINGIPGFHDNSQGSERGTITIYTIETEEIKLCHLSDLGQKELTSEQLDRIGDIDILMIPIGGTYTINSAEAIKIMAQIEPKIIIPMHYKIPKLNVKLDEADIFLKALGIKNLEPLPKLSIKKKDISTEEAKIIILEP
ncbi:MAG: MBL fold metallo-hydrolase [bacterium]|nr:MBL fold metallo-hydrolase [bacterium]